MIIKLTSSKLFTQDPARRFAREYRITEDIWRDLWRRYNLLDYSIPELCEVFYIKVGRPIKRQKMNNWIFKGKIYTLTRDKLKVGIQAVNSTFFGELEERVIKEALRHLRVGDIKKPRMLA